MILMQIAEGWFNGFLKDLNLLDEKTKKLGESRMSVCLECPIRTGDRCDRNKTGSNKHGISFNGCGCIITKKTLCIECVCPGGHW